MLIQVLIYFYSNSGISDSLVHPSSKSSGYIGFSITCDPDDRRYGRRVDAHITVRPGMVVAVLLDAVCNNLTREPEPT